MGWVAATLHAVDTQGLPLAACLPRGSFQQTAPPPRWPNPLPCPQAKMSDDGKHVEVEVESEAKEDGRKEKKEFEYNVPM